MKKGISEFKTNATKIEIKSIKGGKGRNTTGPDTCTETERNGSCDDYEDCTLD